MKNKVSKIKLLLKVGILGIPFLFSGCGGASSSSSTTTTVSSIAQLPDTSTLLSASTSSSLSALSTKDTVTGTPPLLKDFSLTNVDTYFWNGIIGIINAESASDVTADQVNSFWEGEGACRMAQATGYSFQSIMQGATSLCYMKNAPTLRSGIAITSGTATASTLFDQNATTKTIRVQTANEPLREPGAATSQNVFIRVYGSGTAEAARGYAADLWFCSPTSTTTPDSYETIRINSSNVLTDTSVNHESASNTFVAIINATLTTSGSSYIFDPTQARTGQVYFTPGGSNTFLGSISLTGSSLIARDYQTGSFGGGPTSTFKHYITSQIVGSSTSSLRFGAAGFSLQNTFSGVSSNVTGATEYNTFRYTPVTSGSLYTSAVSEDFSNSIYTGSTSAYATLLSGSSAYSCGATPDVTVTMDFSDTAVQGLQTNCENPFSNMDFCDSANVNGARIKIISYLGSH